MKYLNSFESVESNVGTIEDRVLELVKKSVAYKKEISTTTTFGEIEADIVDIVEISILLEEEFGIDIPDQKIDDILKNKKYLQLPVNFLIKIVMDLK